MSRCGGHTSLTRRRPPTGASCCWGGALADPVDGAALLFEGDAPDAAELFARTDPYVLAGLVGSWEVRRWHTVVGAGAAHRP